ncbi:MAG: hypothetical protein JWO98_5317 [Frankiales bacterium]|nr:hypothetical protein [Frankiales bacterium]
MNVDWTEWLAIGIVAGCIFVAGLIVGGVIAV